MASRSTSIGFGVATDRLVEGRLARRLALCDASRGPVGGRDDLREPVASRMRSVVAVVVRVRFTGYGSGLGFTGYRTG